MKKNIAVLIVSVAAIAVIGGIRTGFGGPGVADSPQNSAPTRQAEDSAPGVTVDAEGMERAGIETAAVLQATRRADAEAIATALLPQELLDTAAGLSAARVQMDKADAASAASRKEYERLKVLHADDRNVSDKALEAAEAARRADEAASRGARVAFDAAMNAARRKWGDPLAAAMSENGPLFRGIAEGRRILLRVATSSAASAPPSIAIGTSAGKSVIATLLSASPQADPRIQGNAFLYEAAADGIVPGVTLAARLPVGPEETGAVLPDSALVWWQGKGWFYAPAAAGRFERMEAAGARQVAEGWFVPGLTAKQVVTQGAQSLLSEELRALVKAGEEEK